MARQGAALLKLGPRAALMKGGHLEGDEAVDLLVTADGVRRYAAPRIASRNLHGTGCTLSSAIAANVVLGAPLPEAVAAAKAFVREAIERGRRVTLGAGAGPLIQARLRIRNSDPFASVLAIVWARSRAEGPEPRWQATSTSPSRFSTISPRP